jgi:hypothetical protein
MLTWGLFLAGCATPAPGLVKAPPSPAHLIVINLTDYEWHIAIARPSGDSVHDSRLQPRASLTVDLVGGDYVIEQTALSENAAPELTRKIPARLEPGQTYRWRLVTLLSEPAGNSVAR